MTKRRALLLLAVLVLVVLAYSGWRAWQVQQDLAAAENAANKFIAAVDSDDADARQRAYDDLRRHAEQADDGTSGALWSAFTHVPVVGDDAEGIQALSSSLREVAEGAKPLSAAVDDLDEVTGDGRVNLDVVESLEGPVADSAHSFDRARAEVDGLDSSGYAGTLRTRFDNYVDRITDAAANLAVARRTLEVLPSMAGADGPRTYLFVFQNNAEIRATGGLPGSWSEVRADGGRIEIVRQGAGSDFPVRETPPIPLTTEERSVYGDTMGQYFLGANFTPDFPRAAELWQAHYRTRFPETQLDGVLSLDPVSVSYLLAGTGPIVAGGVTLTPDTAVEQLLSEPYLTLGPRQQDRFFREVARSLFTAVTSDLASPRALVEGLARAGREGRFLVAPFDEAVANNLSGSRVLGEFGGDDGASPRVDVALNDATGSKMSYYLRYRASVESVSCANDRQTLEGKLTLRQAIRPADARRLPPYVTGGGRYGTTPGEQTVFVQIYGPVGAKMDDLRINGEVEPDQVSQAISGRPVFVLAMSVESLQRTEISWFMQTDQTGSGFARVTPSVIPGPEESRFGSTCTTGDGP